MLTVSRHSSLGTVLLTQSVLVLTHSDVVRINVIIICIVNTLLVCVCPVGSRPEWSPTPLLSRTIIGHRQNFGGPSVPSGQNSIFPMSAGGRDDGISTLHSHQYSLVDEGVTEEIKRQTFSKHCFTPLHHKSS